jgi:hypothetical protein
VNDRFSVAVGVERVAEFLQLFSQLKIVIDLTIENYPASAILIVYRLLTAVQVDNGKPAHPEANVSIQIKTVVVRSPVTDRIAHPSQKRAINIPFIPPNYSCYSTHIISEMPAAHVPFGYR